MYHTCDVTCALRDRKQMKYDATKVYSLTLTFLDASQKTYFVTTETHTFFICILFSVYSSDYSCFGEPTREFKNLKGNKTLVKEYK